MHVFFFPGFLMHIKHLWARVALDLNMVNPSRHIGGFLKFMFTMLTQVLLISELNVTMSGFFSCELRFRSLFCSDT